MWPANSENAAAHDTSASDPLIIEFVGFPGSGKTTTSRALIEQLQTRGYRCVDRAPMKASWRDEPHRRRLLRGYGARHPRLWLALHRLILGIRPWKRWRRSYADFMLYNAAYINSLSRSQCDVLLMDQAFVQEAFTAAVHGTLPTDHVLRRSFRSIYRKLSGRLLIVSLNVDARTAARRIRGRIPTAGRFDRMSERRAAELLETLAQQHQQLLRCAVEASGAPHIALNALDPVETNASVIAREVERLTQPYLATAATTLR